MNIGREGEEVDARVELPVGPPTDEHLPVSVPVAIISAFPYA